MNRYTERAEQYLFGKMSPKEQKVFEEELKSNAELSEALDEARDALIGIESHFNEELKLKLQKATESDEKGAKVIALRQKSKPLRALVAAVAVVLIIATYFVLSVDEPKDLYAEYYTDYPNVIELQQRDEISSLSNAFTNYQLGNWSEAEASFQSLISNNPQMIYPHFYRALCLLNLNKPYQAVSELEVVIQAGDSQFIQPATWYLALAQLRAGNASSVLAILREIVEGKGEYAAEAADLLDDLK